MALRAAARGSSAHARTPEIVANLAAGWSWRLSHAVDARALAQSLAEELWARVWTALGAVAVSQDEHQRGSEPTQRFLELLSSALATGRAHVAAMDGSAPTDAEAWGWRRRAVGTGEYEREAWQAQGRRVG